MRKGQKLGLLRRVILWQAEQQHLQSFRIVIKKLLRVIAANAVAGEESVNPPVQTLLIVVQEEGNVRKFSVVNRFAYVVVQLHFRRLRHELKGALRFPAGQMPYVGKRAFYSISVQLSSVA